MLAGRKGLGGHRGGGKEETEWEVEEEQYKSPSQTQRPPLRATWRRRESETDPDPEGGKRTVPLSVI